MSQFVDDDADQDIPIMPNPAVFMGSDMSQFVDDDAQGGWRRIVIGNTGADISQFVDDA